MARWLRGSGSTSVTDHSAASAPAGRVVRSASGSLRPRRATPMMEPTMATATTTRVTAMGSMSLSIEKGTGRPVAGGGCAHRGVRTVHLLDRAGRRR